MGYRGRRKERVCVSVFVTDRERFYVRHKLRVFDLEREIQLSCIESGLRDILKRRM